MSEYINKTSAATDELVDVSYSLILLGRAFSETGNDFMAEKMHNMAEQIQSSQDDIRDAMAENINEGLRESQQFTGKVLKTCLDVSLRTYDDRG